MKPNNSNSKIAVVYLRTATKAVENDPILTAQEKLCRDAATKDGHEQPVVIKHTGQSGTRLSRQCVKKLLNLLREDRVSAIYTTESYIAPHTFGYYFWLDDFFDQKDVPLKFISPVPQKNHVDF